MQSLNRYAFGLVVCAASCGQILDVDAPYQLDPEASGGAGGAASSSSGVDVSSSSSTSSMMTGGAGGIGGSPTGGMGGMGGGAVNVCGDGQSEGSEQCDDGNMTDGDNCDSNCTVTACGNGINTSGEECDDGNMTDGDGCAADCKVEIVCGNGVVEAGESCDDMNKISGDGCDANCTITACGNAIATMGEQCDDGNNVNGDGCDSNCTPSACGNGIAAGGEQCDDGNNVNGDGCDSNCTPSACGNGIAAGGEQCDDGNNINNDACGTDCLPTPRSCLGLAENCGPFKDENCCSPIEVPGGTYNRNNNASYPATVSGFRLDRFEVTVGRFRKFVEAYPANKPIAGAGANPVIAQSGWNSAWDANLPADQAALRVGLDCSIYSIWTDTAGTKEVMPIHCVKWYEAFAFCAWDGGRLPTEAEWNYAAAGGAQQRYYPWSNPASSTAISASYANYNCYGDGSAAQDCKIEDILAVGSRAPIGDGLWKHADLAGSMLEWTLDLYSAQLILPCINCANLVSGTDRVARGGNWGSGSSFLANINRDAEPPNGRDHHVGLRCARGL